MDTLADRIRARLGVLEKSASAASLEAGLGKSAIQDILNGNSISPRLDTLEKLTAPLQCSITYLVSGDRGLGPDFQYPRHNRDIRFEEVSWRLESGVFRREIPRIHIDPDYTDRPWQIAVSNHPRSASNSVELYKVEDRSLVDIGIIEGDVLICSVLEKQFELKSQQIVVVRRFLSAGLSELSARVVGLAGPDFCLMPRNEAEKFEWFDIPGATNGADNTYDLPDGYVRIEAIATAVHRDLFEWWDRLKNQ